MCKVSLDAPLYDIRSDAEPTCTPVLHPVVYNAALRLQHFRGYLDISPLLRVCIAAAAAASQGICPASGLDPGCRLKHNALLQGLQA